MIKYNIITGVTKVKTKLAIAATSLALIGGGAGLSLGIFGTAHAASNTVTISGNTAAAENDPGWMFNRDTSTSTPYEFNTDQHSIGNGSLFVKPIGSNPSDKFIAENFIQTPVSSLNSISYDFLIAGNGTAASADQFYLNVYANYTNSNNFYDCRFDYVPSTGSTSAFTTATFNSTATPVNVAHRGSGPACPTTLSGMPSGSYVRMFSLSVGDTSNSDQGLAGYLDNVVVNGTPDTTTYDFEPLSAPSITSPANGAVLTTANLVKIDWTDVTNAAHYQYRAYSDPGYSSLVYDSGQTLTASEIPTPGTPEGNYYVQVRAIDGVGSVSAWSNGSTSTYLISVDNTAPVVQITNPADGSTVSGTVDVRGSVNDAHPDHYYTVVLNSSNSVVAGPGSVNDTNSFTDQSLFNWNTTLVPNGTYKVDLEARDQAGNKDAGLVDVNTVTVHNLPTTKDMCKDGHWTFYGDMFRNQGQCVSWVEHNVLNHGDKDKDHDHDVDVLWRGHHYFF